MQFSFKFHHKTQYQAEDFFVTESNKVAYKHVVSFPSWGYFCSVIHGAAGAGKTHLCQVWQSITGAKALNLNEDLISQLSDAKNVHKCFFIEISEILTEQEQNNLFYIYNYLKENNGFLLITSVYSVDEFTNLPDLQSRLKIANLLEISPPDDDLLKLMFAKGFSDRQIVVNPVIIDYLVKHCPRSGLEVTKIVDFLDGHSITKPLNLNRVRELIKLT